MPVLPDLLSDTNEAGNKIEPGTDAILSDTLTKQIERV